MAVENVNYINGLVETSPVNTDSIVEGAAHLRIIKKTLKATFPNIDAPVTPTEDYLNQMNISGLIMVWPNNTPPTGWKLCSASAGNTSGGLAIPNLNTSNRVGTTYWIIKD